MGVDGSDEFKLCMLARVRPRLNSRDGGCQNFRTCCYAPGTYLPDKYLTNLVSTFEVFLPSYTRTTFDFTP